MSTLTDYRKELTTQIYQLLSGITNVYSIIPDDTSHPFVYIGSIDNSFEPVKDSYRQSGIISLQYFTGFEQSGSLSNYYDTLSLIKEALKPSLTYVIDLSEVDWDMIYWRLESETTQSSINSSEKIFSTLLQFKYDVKKNPTLIVGVAQDFIYAETKLCCGIEATYYLVSAPPQEGDYVYQDIGLTTPAAGGWYTIDATNYSYEVAEGGYIRNSEPCSYGYFAGFHALSYTQACDSAPLTPTFSTVSIGSWGTGIRLYRTKCLQDTLPNGYYSVSGNWYRTISGTIIQTGACPKK